MSPEKTEQIIDDIKLFRKWKVIYSIKMELPKIVNLLDTTSHDKDLPRCATKKWIEVYGQSEKHYDVDKEIRIKTPMLRTDLCDVSDAYIFTKGEIVVTNPHNAKRNKTVAFKNNAPFITAFQKLMACKLTTQKT